MYAVILRIYSEWKSVGEWRIERCASDRQFVKRLQKCEIKSNIRRQQQLCSIGAPGSFACLQPAAIQACAGVSSTLCGTVTYVSVGTAATVNAQCDWMTTRLMPDTYSQAFYLQCAPTAPGFVAAPARAHSV
jgi:hypothetical protein